MFTSIKIYNAKPLLNKDENKYQIPKGLKATDEQYPKLLMSQKIKLNLIYIKE